MITNFALKNVMLEATDIQQLFDNKQMPNIVVCTALASKVLPNTRLLSPQQFRDMTSVSESVFLFGPEGGAAVARCIEHARKLQKAGLFTASFMICVPSKQGRNELKSSPLRAVFSKGHKVLDVESSTNVRLPRPLQVFDGTWHKRAQVCASLFQQSHLAMSFPGRLAGIPARALIDSGATDCFIAKAFVQNHKLKVKQHTDSTLTLGDGTVSAINGTAKLSLDLQSYRGQIQFFVIDLAKDVDVVLGDSWLRKTKAILDYGKHVVTLVKGSKRITLSPVSPALDRAESPPKVLTALQVRRAVKRQCRCFLVQVSHGDRIDDQMDEDLTWADATAGETPPPLKTLLEEYADVFPVDLPDSLPPDRGVRHTIPLEPGGKPPWRPIYRLSPLEHQEVQTQIQALLDKGWIEPSASPYGAPILFVQKKDGSLRMCVDYRALNNQTVKNRYPLPRIDDLMAQLHGAKVFTSLDLAQGYHQIRITPEDVPKTAFRTPLGHFQYKVLPFGLTNAPATFQEVMNDIFRPYLRKFVLIYLDDILIYSKTPEEHVEHMRLVLEVLRRHKFYAKKKKCTFMAKELLYLGHIISDNGIRPDPAKIAAVKEWAVPKDLHELRSFLGFGNFFRKFLQGYSKMVLPLTRLTQSKVPWVWTPACQDAFEQVKYALTHAPTLVIADPTKPYEVIADASGECLGAILLQDGRPVAFESHRMNPAERNYSATEQECLAVIHALRIWRAYLEGAVFTVITDHKPNTYLSDQPSLSRRQARWSEYLTRFPCQWVYRPGRLNCADPLSRHRREFLVLTRAKASAVQTQAVVDAVANASTHTPADLHKNWLSVAEAHGPTLSAQSASQLDLDDLKLRIQQRYAHDPLFLGDQGEDNRNKLGLEFRDGFWHHGEQIAVPDDKAVRELILRELHDPPYSGHGGVAKTHHSVARSFWWQTLRADVKRYVDTCLTCQRDKASTQKPAGLLQPLPIPDRNWSEMGMDFITGLPWTKHGHNAILTFVDRLSKMCHFVATVDTVGAEETASLYINNVFRLHGMQQTIVSDRDPRFTSAFWQETMKRLGTKSKLSTAFHPETDGQAERSNRMIEDFLRHYVNASQDNWDDLLPVAEYALNNAYQESIKGTPFELNYGQHPLNPLLLATSKSGHSRSQQPSVQAFHARMSTAMHKAKEALRQAQDRQKRYADEHRREVALVVGQLVLLKTQNLKVLTSGTKKLLPRWVGPFKVLEQLGPVAYKLELPANMRCHPVFHVSLLKPFRTDPGRFQPPPPPLLVDADFEYEVERIVDQREIKSGRGSTTKREYFVKWLGYGAEHNTWEPEGNLTNCQELIQQYWDSLAAATAARAHAKGIKRVRQGSAVF